MKRFAYTLLCAFSLFLPALSQGQFAVFFGQNVVSGNFTVPAQMSDDWPVFGPAVTCDGGTLCPVSSAFHIDTVPSTLSSNPAFKFQMEGVRSIRRQPSIPWQVQTTAVLRMC
jgi:hypothetical protein